MKLLPDKDEEIIQRLTEFIGDKVNDKELNDWMERTSQVVESHDKLLLETTRVLTRLEVVTEKQQEQINQHGKTLEKVTEVLIRNDTEIAGLKNHRNRSVDFSNRLVIGIVLMILGTIVGYVLGRIFDVI